MDEHQRDQHDNTDDRLKELGRLAYTNMSLLFQSAKVICKAVDDGELDEVFRLLKTQQDLAAAPLSQSACLSVLHRHKQLDDWNMETMEDDVVQAMKAEHESYAGELPARIRALLVAYEMAIDQYRALCARSREEAKIATKRICELYPLAYQVTCPECGSVDVQAIYGNCRSVSFKCNVCVHRFEDFFPQ